MLDPEDLGHTPEFERRLRRRQHGDHTVESFHGHVGRIVPNCVQTATRVHWGLGDSMRDMTDLNADASIDENQAPQGAWTGQWRNQHGSILIITNDARQRIQGTFRTALGDSAFAAQEVEITGIHLGDCIHFAFSRSGPTGDTIASFTGLLREGRLETLWHVTADSAVKSPQPGQPPQLIKLPWAHAALTNADTFQRVR